MPFSSSPNSHRQSPSAERFARLNKKTRLIHDRQGFELSRTDLFLDGNLDILDILAYRNTLEKDS